MTTATADPNAVLRPHAEQEYQAELAALAAGDDRPRPPGWRLSPWAVMTYLLGGTAADGTEITPKYVGLAGWSRSPSPRWPPTGPCSCSACRARPRPGCPSTWPRPFPATPR